MSASSDSSSRFVFAGADIRGNVVRLQDSLDEATARQNYPLEVQALLGEFLAAALLLGDTIKFEGQLTLQITGQGLIPVLMAQATHDGSVHGIARLSDGATPEQFVGKDLKTLFEGGTLAVTIEPTGKDRYQSIVPLVGESLAVCLENYFVQSEQLNTSINLTGRGNRAAGMLVQQLPAQLEPDADKREDQWHTAVVLAATLSHDELLDQPGATIIRHLFADMGVTLFDESPVRFKCTCSELRMASALVSLGEDELLSLFEEQKMLQITCEFCGMVYDIDDRKLTELVTRGVAPH